ncbi:MAG: CapA family protein [Clostridiales bacterium]|nr:CapA family protein [Clostridiales bacterium]
MSIVIGADIVPLKSNFELFNSGDALALIGKELFDILKNTDYHVFNLEVPLTDNGKPIDKNGPTLGAPTSTINGYRALGVDLLTVANNHILDQGKEGFFDTLSILDKNDIKHVGGGKNLNTASESFIKEINGKKIGFYACAEHEFSIATDKTCGANPFDPLESFDHVVKLKKECDYVIVLYHGGKEHYRYPSPNLQKTCRKFVEKGANLVICQHSHCIGCKEDYQDGTIVYGQGNFIFDRNNKGEYWDTSLLIRLKDDHSIEYIPLVKVDGGVRLAEGENAQEIINNFDKRSKEITIDGFIEKKYSAFASKMIEGYLFSFCGMKRTFMFRVINKLTGYRYSKWLLKKKFNKKRLLAIENYINCEAHRELFLKGIE